MSPHLFRLISVVALCGVAACSGEVSPAGGGATAGSGAGSPGAGGSTASTGSGASSAGNGAPPGTGGMASSDPSTAPPVVCDQVKAGPRRLWRLTSAQYDNTIRDLFGMESAFGQGFPADEVIHGFSNSSDVLQVTPLLADKLQSAAQDISGRVELSRLAPCATAAKDDACLRDVATRFGERMFRRPLKTAEVDRYAALAKTAGNFDAGARLMVLAFLQSPNFLYRFELGSHDAGTRFVLNDYEVASELSYLVWQTTPDDTLLAAARADKLHEPAQVRAQLDRLLQSERAKPVVRAFVFDWLGLSAVTTVPKDTGRFPELSPEIRSALRAEAERFVDHVMFAPGNSLSGLLTSTTTYLDAALATFYGAGGAADPSKPTLLSGQERRGILTLGATMLTHARSNDSSPVHRGKLVRERLLCQTLPPPPPGIVVQPPPLDPSKTTRERYAAHSSVEPCASCHRLMDPIGLAFEHYDGIGRYRANDNGQPIDVHGEILGSLSSNGKFNGVSELIDQLDASADVQACYALSWLRFAYGLDEMPESACVTARVQREVSGSDGSIGAIFAALTQDEQFYARTGDPNYVPPEPPPEPPPGTTPEPSGDTQPPSGLDMQQTQNNDWGTGYCKAYQLKNLGTTPITWSITLMVDGKMNNHWECDVSADTGSVTFTGAPHNATLQPNAQGSFGFCANR